MARQCPSALQLPGSGCRHEPGECIQQTDLEAALGTPARSELDALDQPLGDGFNLERHLHEIQRHYLRRAMEEAHGVKTRAAELLGISNYQTLDAQLKRLNVKWTKKVP